MQHMKISIDRKVLTDALAEVAPFAPQKTPTPILKYTKVTTKGNRIKFESNNIQASIRKYAVAEEIDTDGEFLIEANVVLKYISKLSCNTIQLIVEDSTMTIKHPKGKSELSIVEAKEYPIFDMPTDDAQEVNIPAAFLAEAVVYGRAFVSNEDVYPYLKPIYAYVKDGEFGYCASDTRKLIADHSAVNADPSIDIHWFIEPSVFTNIVKGCKGVDNVTVKTTPSHVSYRLGDTIIQTIQTKGRFPDWNRVIPKDWTIECHVDRNELTATVERVAMFADETDRLVKLIISPIEMVISTDDLTTMRRSSETIQHNGCNCELTIGFRSDYLQTCISAFGTNEVAMRFTNESRPLLLHCEERPNAVIMLMPMSIN